MENRGKAEKFDEERWQQLIGQTFGKLTVLELLPVETTTTKPFRNYNRKFRCRCCCGTINDIIINSVVNGYTQSCGCLQKEKTKQTNALRRKWVDEIEPQNEDDLQRLILYHYEYLKIKRKSLKEHGQASDLSFTEFIALIEAPCYYCNATKTRPYHYKHKKLYHRKVYANGLDRVSPMGGYTKDNTVPCCSTCNFAKRIMSQGDFIGWVEKAYTNLKSKGFYAKELS